MQEQPRRLKIIRVTPEAIFCVLFGWHKSGRLVLPYIYNLPDDLKMHSIVWRPEYCCFDMYVESREFEEVLAGDCVKLLQIYSVDIEIPGDTHEIIKEKVREVGQQALIQRYELKTKISPEIIKGGAVSEFLG